MVTPGETPLNNFVTNIVALGLGPESGTRYSGTNSASGLAADLPIGPGASSLKGGRK